VCCLVYFFIIFFFFTFSFKDDVLSSSFEFLGMLLCLWHTLSSPRSFKTLGLELHGQSHSPAAVANDCCLQQQTQQQKQELGLAHHRLPAAAAVSLHQIQSPEQATKTLNIKKTKAEKKTTTAASKQKGKREKRRGEKIMGAWNAAP
jgi:hypothetical protein